MFLKNFKINKDIIQKLFKLLCREVNILFFLIQKYYNMLICKNEYYVYLIKNIFYLILIF